MLFSQKFFEKNKRAISTALEKCAAETAFEIASCSLEQLDSALFLQHYCALAAEPDPRCLCLLAVCMEESECGLEADINVIRQLVWRAHNYCVLHEPKCSTKRFVAATHLARLQLDFPAADESTLSAANSALQTLQTCEIPTECEQTDQQTYERDYFTLLARICDAQRQDKFALQVYENLWQKDQTNAFFSAKMCVLATRLLANKLLTPAAAEAKIDAHIETAIAWLDDQGVGKNDHEMPELVCAYGAWALGQPFLPRAKTFAALERASDCGHCYSSFALYRIMHNNGGRYENNSNHARAVAYLERALAQADSDLEKSWFSFYLARHLYIFELKNRASIFVRRIDRLLTSALRADPTLTELRAFAMVFYNFNIAFDDGQFVRPRPVDIAKTLKPTQVLSLARAWGRHSQMLAFQLLNVVEGWRPGSQLLQNEIQILAAKQSQRRLAASGDCDVVATQSPTKKQKTTHNATDVGN